MATIEPTLAVYFVQPRPNIQKRINSLTLLRLNFVYLVFIVNLEEAQAGLMKKSYKCLNPEKFKSLRGKSQSLNYRIISEVLFFLINQSLC